MLLLLIPVTVILAVVAGLAAARVAGPAARRWLRWAALAAAAVTALVLAPSVVHDAGAFTAVLLGVPVALAALPLAWEMVIGEPAGRRATVDWIAAVLAMSWAILLALGIGLAFLPAAGLQLAAASATAGRHSEVGPPPR